jgi:hypothetical protein
VHPEVRKPHEKTGMRTTRQLAVFAPEHRRLMTAGSLSPTGVRRLCRALSRAAVSRVRQAGSRLTLQGLTATAVPIVLTAL